MQNKIREPYSTQDETLINESAFTLTENVHETYYVDVL